MSNETIIALGGETLHLDASGALWWPRERTLVFSDLHLEKGSFFARTGQFLPPYDSRATLARMARAVALHEPARIIALGDSSHDAEAADRLGATERAQLAALGRAQWIWIAGNHDPAPPAWLGGERCESFALGGLRFRHEPLLVTPPGEVAGHLHPCARVARWGRSVRRRCFVSDGKRLLLPAFGAYAGGLDIGEDAIRTLFAGPFHAWLLGRERVHGVAFQAGRRNTTVESQPRNSAISTVKMP